MHGTCMPWSRQKRTETTNGAIKQLKSKWKTTEGQLEQVDVGVSCSQAHLPWDDWEMDSIVECLVSFQMNWACSAEGLCTSTFPWIWHCREWAGAQMARLTSAASGTQVELRILQVTREVWCKGQGMCEPWGFCLVWT